MLILARREVRGPRCWVGQEKDVKRGMGHMFVCSDEEEGGAYLLGVA
jgi:hypothetical protein